MLNVFQPALGTEELEAVGRVFESNWVGKGKIADQFEADFALHVGVDRGLIRSVSCCTEGLFQAMALLDIGPGDEVILPSISFVGAANAIASAGAKPVFCDVDRRTLNATAMSIDERTTLNTKAVILLHYGGLPCDMDEICQLIDQRGIALIEDSACSVASRYNGQACGTFGDIGVWSFDAMKILVTGDGGMVYCKTPEMSRRFEALVYLGLQPASGHSASTEARWWEFDVSCDGRRAIMNDIASAIGIEQLKKLPSFIARRRQVHSYYSEALASLSWLQPPPKIPAHVESSYYFYWVQTDVEVRDQLAIFLRDRGIYTTFRYQPLHRLTHYGATARLRNAEEAAQITLCIPLHQALSDADLAKIVQSILDFGRAL